ncbi:putative recombinase [Oscillibacter valericigenes Sjm18-20]|nr:putative recombinase [Oscillibacter valericigenes Sjm18-20]
MDQYLIYLRKSRQDRDLELQTGVFDTLQRHRDTLMALAKSYGYRIACVFEEVVSGDTIAERPEMQKLLSAVETGKYAGVLVMEVPRLARGNTRDQGTVAETFQYSGTKIITPDKIYDPSNESDEEYFEFGLFMSRREYKAINRRLQRGRMASLNEGKYIAGTPPYGYRKIKITRQKGYTLEIIPEQAEVVREIFSLYTVGDPCRDGTLKPIGSYGIANQLNARSIPSPGGVKWSAASVRDILKNPTYAGYVRWAYRPERKQMVDGSVVVSHPVSHDNQMQKGLHPAIITQAAWKAARSAMLDRSHAPVPGSGQISNPLAGILYCSACGRSLVQLPQGSHGMPMLLCPTPKCPSVGSRLDVIEAALLDGLQDWLDGYRVSMPKDNLLQPGGQSALRDAERSLTKATANLAALKKQKGSLCDLLEQGIYTQDIYLERSHNLDARVLDAEKRIRSLSGHLTSLHRAELAGGNLIPQIQNVLDVYGVLETSSQKNALLKSVLDHVIYSKTVGGKWKESDLKLFIYPKITPFSDEL